MKRKYENVERRFWWPTIRSYCENPRLKCYVIIARHNRQSHGGQKASTRCWLWHCLVRGRDAALALGVGRAGRAVAATRAICDANCCTRRDAPRRFTPHALPADCRNHCNYCEKYSFVRFYTHIIIIQPLPDLHNVHRCMQIVTLHLILVNAINLVCNSILIRSVRFFRGSLAAIFFSLVNRYYCRRVFDPLLLIAGIQ